MILGGLWGVVGVGVVWLWFVGCYFGDGVGVGAVELDGSPLGAVAFGA